MNNDSTGGTAGPSDGGSGFEGGQQPPPSPPGATDGGDGGPGAGCATSGYYAVQDGSPGARLYRVATTSAAHDAFIGALKTAGGTPVFGFSAVAAIPGGGLVGFVGPNSLTLTNTLVSIDTATAIVTTVGTPTDTSQTMTALSYAGATGRFLAAYTNGTAACIDLPGNQFVALLLKTIPTGNEVLHTGALHGQCGLDGSCDFRAIHHIGEGGSGYYLHCRARAAARR